MFSKSDVKRGWIFSESLVVKEVNKWILNKQPGISQNLFFLSLWLRVPQESWCLNKAFFGFHILEEYLFLQRDEVIDTHQTENYQF